MTTDAAPPPPEAATTPVVDHPETPPMVGYWICGEGHIFTWGDEDWHARQSQPEGGPAYCTAELAGGDPCMDSSHLLGPYPTRDAADEGLVEAIDKGWLN